MHSFNVMNKPKLDIYIKCVFLNSNKLIKGNSRFISTIINNEPCPKCMLCFKITVNDIMKPF